MNKAENKFSVAVLILGVFVGCLISLTINAIITNASIKPDDPSTWPNMGPGIRIMFFPIVGIILSPIVTLSEFILKKLLNLKHKNKLMTLLIGSSYTTLLISTSPAWYWLIFVVIINPLTIHFLNHKIKNV